MTHKWEVHYRDGKVIPVAAGTRSQAKKAADARRAEMGLGKAACIGVRKV